MNSPSLLSRTLLAGMLAGAPAAGAAVYYVATNGHDTASGSAEAPWRTVWKAAQTLVAGDTVYVRQGVYTGAATAANAGTSNRWITYAAFPGETVILDGLGTEPGGGWSGVMGIHNLGFIRIEGFRVIRSAYAGLLAEDSHDIVFRGNATSSTWSSGISAWGCTNLLIESNDVQRACQGEGAVAVQECLTVSNTDGFEIRGNRVWNRPVDLGWGGEGICVKDASRNGRIVSNVVHGLIDLGIYIDAFGSLATNIEASGNVVYDCAHGIVLSAENGGTLCGVRVVNNVAFNNRWNGVEISDYEADGPRTDLEVFNNTLVSNGHAGAWGGGICVSSRNAQNRRFTLRNNLCSGNHSWQIGTVPMTGLTVDHNLLDEYQGYVDESFQEITGTAVTTGTPRFMAASAGNFHLRPGSPGVDAGAPDGAPSVDFDGRTRPADGTGDGVAAVDLGAFEVVPPVIIRMATSGGISRVSWEALSGAVYRVQHASQMSPPTWTNLSPDVTASGPIAERTDASASNALRRFYRVRALE